MAVRSAICISCDRQVYVSDDSPLVCPVCSSPLSETPSGQEEVDTVARGMWMVGPEIYLG